MTIDAVITSVLVFGALISVWIFYRRYAEGKQNREYAVVTFDSAKEETAQLRQRLENYADKHQAWEDHFMQRFTFREAIDKLEESEREIFTPKNREALEGSTGRGINFENLVERLENHRLYLNQAERVFERDFQDD
jgi:hypothetical protein